MTYARALIAIALFVAGFWLGGIQARGASAARERDQVSKQLDEIQKAQDEDKRRAERLQKTIDALPKSEGTIREIVRENPAPCDMPAPVADGLHGAVNSANRARKVPADS